MDTCFGFIRAIKEHKFNSGFGIDGAIRKTTMLASLAFLLLFDRIVHLNLIGFIPEAARVYLPVDSIGVAEFFGLLYIAYELVSILKNMTLCGLPVKRLWEMVKKFLTQYTDELTENT
jgi:toxin secretion/phage lysis holin